MGDEAFPILENLLKPYPRNQSLHDRKKAIFNYRLSRARRIVENAFGILTQNFRIFSTAIHLNVEVIEDLVTAACILHNMIIEERGVQIEVDESRSNNLESIQGHEIETDASQELKYKIRDTFMEYFNSPGGEISWQNDTFRL